jgi:hypothetical protein
MLYVSTLIFLFLSGLSSHTRYMLAHTAEQICERESRGYLVLRM